MEKARQYLIDFIEATYPADGDGRAQQIGIELLEDVVGYIDSEKWVRDWRNLPDVPLKKYAFKCAAYEFSGYPGSYDDECLFREGYYKLVDQCAIQ